MALKLSYIAAQGYTASEAYHRITNLSGTAAGMTATVATSFDAAARAISSPPLVAPRAYTFVPDSQIATSLWQQAYAAVKTQPDFQGAVDV